MSNVDDAPKHMDIYDDLGKINQSADQTVFAPNANIMGLYYWIFKAPVSTPVGRGNYF